MRDGGGDRKFGVPGVTRSQPGDTSRDALQVTGGSRASVFDEPTMCLCTHRERITVELTCNDTGRDRPRRSWTKWLRRPGRQGPSSSVSPSFHNAIVYSTSNVSDELQLLFVSVRAVTVYNSKIYIYFLASERAPTRYDLGDGRECLPSACAFTSRNYIRGMSPGARYPDSRQAPFVACDFASRSGACNNIPNYIL